MKQLAGWFLILVSLFLVTSIFLYNPALKDNRVSSSSNGAITSEINENKVVKGRIILDERVPHLRGYLKAKGSPLASKAAEMIAAADKYHFDWRLFPAIAGKESSFGRKIPWDKEGQKPSYNAWGWGIYGDQILSFSSWDEGIEKVGAGLRNGYLNKNLVTPEDIMRYFTPRSKGDWARDVSYIMEEIGE